MDSSSSMMEIREADNRVTSKPKRLGHSHEIRERARTPSCASRAAMDFHSDFGKTQIACHLLVHLSGGDKLHYLLLARRERREFPTQCRLLVIGLAPRCVPGNRGGDGIEHVLVAEWLDQENRRRQPSCREPTSERRHAPSSI